MDHWKWISQVVGNIVGESPEKAEIQPVSGGCINETAVLRYRDKRYFVKCNDARRQDMFAAEAAGLEALASTHTVRVPRPLGAGNAAGKAFLVLEYLPLTSARPATQAKLGRQLCALHRVTQSHFGWHRDNTIGATPQRNAVSAGWLDFWRQHRLGYQLRIAGEHSDGQRCAAKGEKLLAVLDAFFVGYQPVPSLLHGDLWAGNVAEVESGTPVIFDPAVYYGDREADIAMTELFGGFSADFCSAYRECWPLDPGYRVRRDLYNLYHILNHAHLFGGAYWAQSERLIDRLCAEAQ